MTTRGVSLLIGAGLVGLLVVGPLLYALFVWPTPYEYKNEYDATGIWVFRYNRLTGTKDVRPPHTEEWFRASP